jgi:tRNA U34 5-carboxymethylaminomethyl modifying enzyme MnmG/GidA
MPTSGGTLVHPAGSGSKVVAEQAEIHAKYEGYIVKQQQAVEKALEAGK